MGILNLREAAPSPETKKETDEGAGGKSMNSSIYKINTEKGEIQILPRRARRVRPKSSDPDYLPVG